MAGPKAAVLDALREEIARIEKRPALAEGAALAAARLARGDAESEIDLLAAPAGVSHEIYADRQRDAGAALGFALGLARGLVNARRPAVLYLQLTSDGKDLGLPYGPGLASLGFPPEALVIGRIASLTELLWATEEAIACRAVAAVIADVAYDHRQLDFTVSRRLSLRAAAAGTSFFLIRYGAAREASAARLRWRVAPALSAVQRFDHLAPGPPRFVIDIEKRRLGRAPEEIDQKRLIVDWTDHGFVTADPFRESRAPLRRRAPAHGSQPAALGHRLSEAS